MSTFEEKDTSIEGGMLRWFAISVKRGYRAQLVATPGVVLATLPLWLVVGSLVWLDVLGGMWLWAVAGVFVVIHVEASSFARKHELDLDNFLEDVSQATADRTSTIPKWLIGASFLGGVVWFSIIAVVAAGLVSLMAGTLGSLLALVSALGIPVAVMAVERYVTREWNRSLAAFGITIVIGLYSRASSPSSRERKQLSELESVVQTALGQAFSNQAIDLRS